MGIVDFRCDLSQRGIELRHSWEHTVGSCHAPIALRADWQQQLRRCQAELGFRYVRFHGLLSDVIGTVVTHNEHCIPVQPPDSQRGVTLSLVDPSSAPTSLVLYVRIRVDCGGASTCSKHIRMHFRIEAKSRD